nr:oxysterol-binding protein homolog 1-like [Ipomoea batatas]GME08049.1 oxysterol-binding protein homolog 1-like [Ipomoea batatas]
MANSSSSSDSNPEIPTNDLPDLEKLSDKVNNGLMLDKDGYLKHSTDRAVTKTFVKCFEHCGLMKYFTHDYKMVHQLDSTEFFVNARMNGKKIYSRVNGIDIVIIYELKFSFKKKVLNPKFEWAIDILSRIVENRVAVSDDVIVEEFSMLGAVLTNYNVDWSMVIYNSLRTKPHAPKGKGATLAKKKVTEEDFSSNLPLVKVTKKANAKRKLEVVEESMPKNAPWFPRHQNQRMSKKKAIEMSPVEGEHVRTVEPREVLASSARVVELTVQEDVETIFLGEDDRKEETSRGVDVSVTI